MASSPNTVDGTPCTRCNSRKYTVVRSRARCNFCGALYRVGSITEKPKLTWDQGRDIYVRRQRRKQSDDSEKAHAVRFGGHTTRGSGSGSEKDDVIVQGERHEMKETIHSSIKLNLRDWLKVQTSALAHGQRPALILTFKRALGRDVGLVVLDIEDYEDLKERARASEEHR